ncbi:MAG: site-specific integrase [Ginsengibacter sp.]
MKVKFQIKTNATKGDCLLFAEIYYSYNPNTKKYLRVKYYTDLRISKNCWDGKNQCAKKGMIGKAEFDLRITNVKEKIQKCFNGYVSTNAKEPDPETLKKLLFKEFTGISLETNNDKLKTFWGYFTDFINQSINGSRKNANGDTIAPSTIKSYKTLKHHLQKFEIEARQKIDFDKIDFEFYTDLHHFLETDLLLAKNSISKHIRTLKTVLRESLEKGYHNNSKFSSRKFAAPTELTTAVYLNEKELKELYTLDLTNNPRLEKVRDLFIIGCYTGLRFGDLYQVTTKNIQPDPKNPTDLYLTLKQTKTGKPVTIPIPTVLSQVLAKYGNVLPKPISNQKTNLFLKEICQMIPALNENTEIEFTKAGAKVYENHKKYELISTHTARRSFATNAYLAGQQTLNIMAVTGHLTEKSFNRYIRVTPMEKARLFKQHEENRNHLKAV